MSHIYSLAPRTPPPPLTSQTPQRPTHDPAIDTFRAEYLIGPSLILGLIFNYHFSPTEILWSFSIFLESVAILPQLFMLQRTGEAETITTHYLAALGVYRALYIPNWIYRCVRAVLVSIRACPYLSTC
jgi:ER lumen protein retaining receptor